MNDQTHTHFPAIVEGQIGGAAVQTVNARDLHAALGVGKQFGTWITDRISQFSFGEHVDFEVFPDFGKNPSGGRPAKEYALTLDMAKELAMVERNEAGKRVRQYFIECERKLREPPRLAETMALAALNDPAAMRGILLGYTEKVLDLQAQVGELTPKAEAHDRLAEAHGSVCRSTAAKNLGVPPQTLIRWMRTHNWTFRRVGDKDDLAYQSKIAAGLLEHKVTSGPRPDGTEWTGTQVRVTAKGMLALAKAFPPVASEVKGPSRRVLVAGIGALMVAAVGGMLPAPAKAAPAPAVAASGARTELLDRYIAFLAHEYREALYERDMAAAEPHRIGRIERHELPSMSFPAAQDIERIVQANLPSSRAQAALAAVAAGQAVL